MTVVKVVFVGIAVFVFKVEWFRSLLTTRGEIFGEVSEGNLLDMLGCNKQCIVFFAVEWRNDKTLCGVGEVAQFFDDNGGSALENLRYDFSVGQFIESVGCGVYF
jgi:hypothetical protein